MTNSYYRIATEDKNDKNLLEKKIFNRGTCFAMERKISYEKLSIDDGWNHSHDRPIPFLNITLSKLKSCGDSPIVSNFIEDESYFFSMGLISTGPAGRGSYFSFKYEIDSKLTVQSADNWAIRTEYLRTNARPHYSNSKKEFSTLNKTSSGFYFKAHTREFSSSQRYQHITNTKVNCWPVEAK